MTTERFQVELTRDAQNDLERLRPWTEQATNAILALGTRPSSGTPLAGSLKGTRSQECSLKGSGADPAVYIVADDRRICLVFIVGPHANICDNAERRVAALKGAGRI